MAGQEETEVTYSMSEGLVGFLERLDVSLAISSYQSGKFYLLGRNPRGGLLVDERLFPEAMGIAVDGKRIVLATNVGIIELVSVLKGDERVNEIYDACFTPRRSNMTGMVDAHDVGIGTDGALYFVATKWNCLAAVSRTHNFRIAWQPPFISEMAPGDRCHMNGLAMEDGNPAYVTAVSCADSVDGWRNERVGGGVIIDLKTSEPITGGLSMPHSPRIHQGELYALNSGTGELIRVDRESGAQEVIAFCPGFVRGLDFHEGYAIVGLSRPRYQRFDGLPLDERLSGAGVEAWTGVQIIDLATGTVAEWFRIDGAVAEIYDTAFVPGVACGMSLGLNAPELKDFILIEP